MKLERITINPSQMNGQPCIRGQRLTVKRVVDLLATYPDRHELYQEFPELEEEDIRQALAYVSACWEDARRASNSKISVANDSTVSHLNSSSRVFK
ncbi:DUF433 domain-containing protein [Synechocystis sp. LEGE 06083]|uniref:DUF433 domain-containing protein n=1 Tax=Synechocystis sp. LEGE 06083 TaxID=915336 RepID=UPI00187DFF7C|nr:DUF433 domain-containing protein [Synechocystis sp. LEGE 06083]MBE9194648.1 DUF433 domain-containing protein [Synechocystis sp. LEGE 06083]